MYYAIGVNIGFDSSPTAITVGGVEEDDVNINDRSSYTARTVRKYEIPHLEELPANTDYGVLIDKVHEIISQPLLHNNCSVLLNYSMVGPAAFTMFYKARLKPITVDIRGGTEVQSISSGFIVPISHAISSLHVAFSMSRIALAEISNEQGNITDRLIADLEVFKLKSKGSFEQASGEIQNQMVLSTALTIWWLENHAPVKLPEKATSLADWDWQRGAF